MTDTFSRNFAISLSGHLAIALLVFFQAVLIPHEPIEIQRAIRVDVVGLPEKMTEQELKPAAEPPKAETKPVELPKKETAPPPKPAAPVVSTPSKNKAADLAKSQREALSQLKTAQALEKLKNMKETGKSDSKKEGTLIKGNTVAAGNSLTGLERIEYDRYFDDLKIKVRDNWSVPQWLAEAQLKAQVQVIIDERGYVVKKVIRRSSGNEVFDSSVLEAIDRSSPLTPPPKRLQGLMATSGIVFNFPE